jgi:hypothetical protein
MCGGYQNGIFKECSFVFRKFLNTQTNQPCRAFAFGDPKRAAKVVWRNIWERSTPLARSWKVIWERSLSTSSVCDVAANSCVCGCGFFGELTHLSTGFWAPFSIPLNTMAKRRPRNFTPRFGGKVDKWVKKQKKQPPMIQLCRPIVGGLCGHHRSDLSTGL